MEQKKFIFNTVFHYQLIVFLFMLQSVSALIPFTSASPFTMKHQWHQTFSVLEPESGNKRGKSELLAGAQMGNSEDIATLKETPLA